MPSQRTHTTQSGKHARNAAPARFGIRHPAFAIRPARQNCGNGTIWYTTGSDKTPTSFNASTLGTLRDRLLPKLLSGEWSVPNYDSEL